MSLMQRRGGRTSLPPSDVHVPAWSRDTGALLVVLALAIIPAALTVRAFLARDLADEVVAALSVLALVAFAPWVSGHRSETGRVALALGLSCVAAVYLLHGQTAAVAAVAAVALAAVAGGTYRANRVARRARLEWLAAGLLPLTRDQRPAHEVLVPPRRGHYPIRWHRPPTLLLHEDKTRERVVALVDDRLGGSHEVVDEPMGTSLIQPVGPAAAADEEEPAPEGPKDVQRVNEALVATIGTGAAVDETSITRAEDGTMTGASITWPTAASARMSTTAGMGRATRSLTRVLPGEWQVHWRLTEDRGQLERIEPLPELLPHEPRTPGLGAHIVVFGHDRSGPACWDLDDAEPHFLAGGRTRAGKSTFIRTLSVQLGHPDIGAELILIDPKRAGLRGMEHLPGVTGRYTPRDMDAMIGALTRVYDEMNARYDRLDDGLDRAELRRLVLIIDEGRVLYEVTKEHWNLVEKPEMIAEAKDNGGPKPTGTEHPVMEKVRGILRLGGEAKINVVLISQQADADWLSTEARQNFGCRVALGDPDDEARAMLFGKRTVLPDLPRTSAGNPIKGRAWVSIGGGRPRQVQTYWTPSLHAADLRDKPADRKIVDALGLDLPGLSSAPVVDDEEPVDDKPARAEIEPALPSQRPAAGGLPVEEEQDEAQVHVLAPQATDEYEEVEQPPAAQHRHLTLVPSNDASSEAADDKQASKQERNGVGSHEAPAAGGLPEQAEEEERHVDTAAGDLTEGARADLGEGEVTVLAVEPSEEDDDLVEITYETPDGVTGVFGMDRSETVRARL